MGSYRKRANSCYRRFYAGRRKHGDMPQLPVDSTKGGWVVKIGIRRRNLDATNVVASSPRDGSGETYKKAVRKKKLLSKTFD